MPPQWDTVMSNFQKSRVATSTCNASYCLTSLPVFAQTEDEDIPTDITAMRSWQPQEICCKNIHKETSDIRQSTRTTFQMRCTAKMHKRGKNLRAFLRLTLVVVDVGELSMASWWLHGKSLDEFWKSRPALSYCLNNSHLHIKHVQINHCHPQLHLSLPH